MVVRFSILCCSVMLAASAQERATIRTRVNLVVAPTTVTHKNGKFFDGLSASDFVVLDNGRPQTISMDHSDIALTPISLVIAVQSNGMSASALAKIRKVGSMVEPLITGERGEVAMLRYDEEVTLAQDFTGDSDKIVKAFRSLKMRGDQARTVDAAARAIAMLHERPENRRRILMLISESRDRGSEAKLQDVLQTAQRENVTIYPITFSAHASAWTAKPEDAAATQGGLGGILGIIQELARNAKVNAAEEMARFTGGHRVSFLTLNGLEKELSRIGEELHSQYLISFTQPHRPDDSEFHVLDVRVKDRPELNVRTRPGYWPMAN